MRPPGGSAPGLPSEPLTRPQGIVGPIPLAAVFQGWELVHFASKAKRCGILDNEGRLALYEAGRLQIRGEPLAGALAGTVESVLAALVAARLGEAECDRGDCEACGRLAILEPEATLEERSPVTPVPPAAPTPAGPGPEVLARFAYEPTRIPGLVFSPRNAEVLQTIRDGIVEDPADWVLHYRARLLGLQSGFDRLLSLPLIRGVRHYDYQEGTALKVLREMRGRAILADEVGLGKTIEAGVVLEELSVRGLARTGLILTPASLLVQWQGGRGGEVGPPLEIIGEFGGRGPPARAGSANDTPQRDGPP